MYRRDFLKGGNILFMSAFTHSVGGKTTVFQALKRLPTSPEVRGGGSKCIRSLIKSIIETTRALSAM